MKLLKNYLERLKKGEFIPLDFRENQYGEQIATEMIYFENGEWMRSKLNCYSSLDLGFGTCRCVSHPTYRDEEISRRQALSLLKEKIALEEKDEEARQREITWLDEVI
ncbi:MAG: hypothetical protein ACPLZ9_03990, partial [Candidatus Ratteibacteria bacterium]